MACLPGEVWTVFEITGKIRSMLDDIRRAYGEFLASSKPVRFVGWDRPPPGFFKLNVDGSLQGAVNKGGHGGLIFQGPRILEPSCTQNIEL